MTDQDAVASELAPAAKTEAAPRRQRAPKRLFVAFAGGGAKGIVHVGALMALRARRVRIVGYAGTSAGAIVASLAAAGFKPGQIIHPSNPSSILDLLREHDESLQRPIDLFGPGAWSGIARYRALYGWAMKPRMILAMLALTAATIVASYIIVGLFGPWASGFAIVIWLASMALLASLVADLLAGLARLKTLRNALDHLLSRKIHEGEPGRQAVMGDFDGKRLPRLKIVAADLTGRRLELFSCDTTPSTPVADAVAASICLPVIFGIWRIELGRYVDGGIVSNLPAWPFDEERQLDLEAITVAFEIGKSESGSAAKPPNIWTWPTALLDTAMFGSGVLSLRAVGPSELITFRPSINMMAFDQAPEKAREELENARKFALAEIDRRLFNYPETYEAACEETVVATERFLDTSGVLQASRQGRVRCGVALPPEGFKNSLRLRFTANFENDPDQQVLLPLEGSFVGTVWRSRKHRLFSAPFPKTFDMRTPNRRALRRLFWPDLKWSLCVPIFGADGKPRCVVTVDGSDPLIDNGATRSAFNDLAVEVRKVFTPIVGRLQE